MSKQIEQVHCLILNLLSVFSLLLSSSCALNSSPPSPTISTQTPMPTPSPTQTAVIMPTLVPAPTIAYQLIGNDCSTQNCLFSDGKHLVGITVLKGYYVQVERAAWGSTETCDSFVVVSGSEDLIKEFVDWVDAGNTVNSKNELNQPVINLHLDTLNEDEQQRIFASTLEQPVELLVLRPPPRGMGAGACTFLVRILKVEQ